MKSSKYYKDGINFGSPSPYQLSMANTLRYQWQLNIYYFGILAYFLLFVFCNVSTLCYYLFSVFILIQELNCLVSKVTELMLVGINIWRGESESVLSAIE